MRALITPLIVCGGSGTRLLPVSRGDRPKQFLRLIGKYTTFQETVLRVSDPALFEHPVIVTNRDHRVLVDDQLKELGVEADVLLEPEKRGSGPAILAGTLFVVAICGPDTVVLALAADHAVRDVDGFRVACRDAWPVAQAGSIVTFGIVPDHPATSYGYIEADTTRHRLAYPVRRFVEKPDAETARRYVDQGYFWNSGNFLFRARSLLDEYRQCDSATFDVVVQAVRKASINAKRISLDTAAFTRATSRSIDYAVMEKTTRAAVVPANFDWADVGTWSAVHRLLSGEATGHEQRKIRSLTIVPGEVRKFPGAPVHEECWIIVGGTGRATIAGEVKMLRTDDIIHIPADTTRQVDNCGAIDLRIVAMQTDIQ